MFVGMTGERHVEGHCVVCLSPRRGASAFFKVKGQEGGARAKGHLLIIGFRHVRFDDFHQPTAHGKIVNVLRFKVFRRSIRSKVDFPQDITDLTTHHPTGRRIAMHEQTPFGSHFFLGTIVGIQIHKEPVATHAQLETIGNQGPQDRHLTGGRGVGGVGAIVRVEDRDDALIQLKPAWSPFLDKLHVKGKLSSKNHLRHLTGVIHILGVQEQISVPRPLEPGVQLGAIVLGQFAGPLHTMSQVLLVAIDDGIEKIMARVQQVLLDHVHSHKVGFLSVMVVFLVPWIQQPCVPSNVEHDIGVSDQSLGHERGVGDGHTDQSDLPIGAHEPDRTRQAVFETVGSVVGKLLLVVFTPERHVERMRRWERHGRFLFRVFF